MVFRGGAGTETLFQKPAEFKGSEAKVGKTLLNGQLELIYGSCQGLQRCRFRLRDLAHTVEVRSEGIGIAMISLVYFSALFYAFTAHE